MAIGHYINYSFQILCAALRIIFGFVSKHFILVMVSCFLLARMPAYIREVRLMLRGNQEVALSRDLAWYLSAHDYRFPDNAEEFVDALRQSRREDDYVPCNSVLWINEHYSLPWGHSLTDKVSLTENWFKRLDNDKMGFLADGHLTQRVWSDLYQCSSNKVIIDKLWEIWAENQSRTSCVNHVSCDVK